MSETADLQDYRRCLTSVAEDLRPYVMGNTAQQQTDLLTELLKSLTLERYLDLKSSVETRIRQRAREIAK